MLKTMTTYLGREIRAYPNAIEVWQDGHRIFAFSSQEWAEAVQFVGISGLAPEPV